ncbi:MAG: acyl-CoA dehydratase activase [Candidatus Bathyarchaeia archaeon]
MSPVAAGVDIGSTTAKCAIIADGRIIFSPIVPTGANPTKAGEQALHEALSRLNSPVEKKYVVATGYGRVTAPFADETVTEITCHGRGAHYLDPRTRTVVDIGGQDSKAIALGDDGRVVDFSLNDKCAAGTGRFLEFASRLVLDVQLEELGPISARSTSPATISSTCTVFALTEIVSLLAEGVSRENIVAGLHAAISQRVAAMVRRIGVRPTVMLTGGVAKNEGLRAALARELGVEVNPPSKADPQLVGALGAAILAGERLERKG